MKIKTTAREVALIRLVTFKAPGQPAFRKALYKLQTRVTLLLESVLEEIGGELQLQGGFRFDVPTHPVAVELSLPELLLLDEAFRVSQWDPENVRGPLEIILWELMDEVSGWIKEAGAAEKWAALPQDQKDKEMAAREKRAKKRRKRQKGKKAKEGDE